MKNHMFAARSWPVVVAFQKGKTFFYLKEGTTTAQLQGQKHCVLQYFGCLGS